VVVRESGDRRGLRCPALGRLTFAFYWPTHGPHACTHAHPPTCTPLTCIAQVNKAIAEIEKCRNRGITKDQLLELGTAAKLKEWLESGKDIR
jgi:hypothetical protein